MRHISVLERQDLAKKQSPAPMPVWDGQDTF
jgi:hypothetical protein